MSIRIGLCRFSFPFFALFLVLVCVVVLGWKSGKGWVGRVREGWMGLEGEVVYYWQNGFFLLQFGGRGRGVTANK